MSDDPAVFRRPVEIRNVLGFHMRPAGKFVKVAQCYQSEVRILYNGKPHDGKSILDLIGLAAECGTWIEIEARGPDAADAIEALEQLVLARFHENENENGEAIPAQPTEPAR